MISKDPERSAIWPFVIKTPEFGSRGGSYGRALRVQNDWWGSSDKYLSNPFLNVDSE